MTTMSEIFFDLNKYYKFWPDDDYIRVYKETLGDVDLGLLKEAALIWRRGEFHYRYPLAQDLLKIIDEIKAEEDQRFSDCVNRYYTLCDRRDGLIEDHIFRGRYVAEEWNRYINTAHNSGFEEMAASMGRRQAAIENPPTTEELMRYKEWEPS